MEMRFRPGQPYTRAGVNSGYRSSHSRMFFRHQKRILCILIIFIMVAILLVSRLLWESLQEEGMTPLEAVRTVGQEMGGRVMDWAKGLKTEEGEWAPREGVRLPSLTVLKPTPVSPDMIRQRYSNSDIIYSFVNGTEVNHGYRRIFLRNCLPAIRDLERVSFERGVDTGSLRCGDGLRGRQRVSSDLLNHLDGLTQRLVSTRDRETDELRYSVRSIEEHMSWHTGRIIMVSPGHHPTWVDPARNFLSPSCPNMMKKRHRGAHSRIITVHQDALLPYGARLTIDSHVIEQNLWRVANVTPVHVYFNDDYFVYRDVDVTELFNSYGGTIVRTEGGVVGNPRKAPPVGGSWRAGVSHTHLFNVLELDAYPEDYIPPNLVKMWRESDDIVGTNGANMSVTVPSLSRQLWLTRDYKAEEMPSAVPSIRYAGRIRRYATHAPFVYCTNMMRFLSTRYELEFAHNAMQHRSRSSSDIFIPFVYNAFIMARPWQSSPKFLPYLVDLEEKRNSSERPAPRTIELNNIDGCAPATLLAGRENSECLYGKFTNDVAENEAFMRRLFDINPKFFNINAGCGAPECSKQMRTFLQKRFQQPSYLERPQPSSRPSNFTPSSLDGQIQETFTKMMELPVVMVVSDREGLCPLLRSLQLSMSSHTGQIIVVDAPLPQNATHLDTVRAQLNHKMRSAMPAVRCNYNFKLVTEISLAAPADGPLSADFLRSVLAHAATRGNQTLDFPPSVALPSTCGGDASQSIKAFCLDARTPARALLTPVGISEALAMPGQTLALEDFVFTPVGSSTTENMTEVVAVLARRDANAKAVNWITGGHEDDLLMTYPLPYRRYEHIDAVAIMTR